MQELSLWAYRLSVAIEAAAVLAFALSGLIAGARKQLDAVGVFTVTFLAAFGGGTLRDLLLDQRPFFWVEHVHWLWLLMGLCVAAMLFMKHRHFEPTEKAMQWPDALGLGLFAAAGVSKALHSGSPALVAVLMGVVTGVFGGVLRDVICNDIPRAFQDHQPYALCAFAGGWAYVGWWTWTDSPGQAMLLCVIVTFGLRALALWRHWELPTWKI